jgi:hypothetical protein
MGWSPSSLSTRSRLQQHQCQTISAPMPSPVAGLVVSA